MLILIRYLRVATDLRDTSVADNLTLATLPDFTFNSNHERTLIMNFIKVAIAMRQSKLLEVRTSNKSILLSIYQKFDKI